MLENIREAKLLQPVTPTAYVASRQ